MKRTNPVRAFLYVGAMVAAFVISGCGGKETESASNDSDFEAGSESESDDPNVVSPSSSDAASPVSPNAASLPTDAEPELVVSTYIQALNEGNVSLAESLLTEVAKVETRRSELMPQPAWSDDATYEIQSVNFATERSVRAEVSTNWVERDAYGASADFLIVWMLYKQPHNGWRVSGMKTHFIPGGDLVFLNFEDPEDMIDKWSKGLEEASLYTGQGRTEIAEEPNSDRGIR